MRCTKIPPKIRKTNFECVSFFILVIFAFSFKCDWFVQCTRASLRFGYSDFQINKIFNWQTRCHCMQCIAFLFVHSVAHTNEFTQKCGTSSVQPAVFIWYVVCSFNPSGQLNLLSALENWIRFPGTELALVFLMCILNNLLSFTSKARYGNFSQNSTINFICNFVTCIALNSVALIQCALCIVHCAYM